MDPDEVKRRLHAEYSHKMLHGDDSPDPIGHHVNPPYFEETRAMVERAYDEYMATEEAQAYSEWVQNVLGMPLMDWRKRFLDWSMGVDQERVYEHYSFRRRNNGSTLDKVLADQSRYWMADPDNPILTGRKESKHVSEFEMRKKMGLDPLQKGPVEVVYGEGDNQVSTLMDPALIYPFYLDRPQPYSFGFVTLDEIDHFEENTMSESSDNAAGTDGVDDHAVAADPASDHATPGGQPGDNAPVDDTSGTETVVETPGGTTVSETTPSE